VRGLREKTRLIAIQKDLRPPYDFDAYATPFLPVGNNLEHQADNALAEGDLNKAIELFFRAACVFRLGRFPFLLMKTQKLAWDSQKRAYLKGAR
jgi:hypothetical protein